MATTTPRKISLNEVGYRLADVWDKFEGGTMDDKTAMVNVKIAVAITNTFRTKALVNDFNGVKSDINDMFSDEAPKKLPPNKNKGLIE